jgi:hypothetical protein
MSGLGASRLMQCGAHVCAAMIAHRTDYAMLKFAEGDLVR